jgi:AcrR family transcriptional regulator
MTTSRAPAYASLIQGLASESRHPLQNLGRRERRAAETRLRLFRCALQLFAERGFPNVTVEDITEAADVGKGTFFNYFESKDHVLGVMPEIQLRKVQEALDQAQTGRRSIQSVLRQLFQRLAEEPGRSPELARALVSSFLASEFIRQHLDRSLSQGRQMAAQIVELGQRRGEIDPKLKQENVALLLQQAVMGTVLIWSLRGGAKLQSAIEANFQHFWRAIADSGQE